MPPTIGGFPTPVPILVVRSTWERIKGEFNAEEHAQLRGAYIMETVFPRSWVVDLALLPIDLGRKLVTAVRGGGGVQ